MLQRVLRHLSVCRLSVTLYIVSKRCILEHKLLLTAYRKSYIMNRLGPKSRTWPLYRGRLLGHVNHVTFAISVY